MILKLSTKLGYEKVYCVSENQHLVLIVSFICPFFFLSPKKLLLQISQFLFEPVSSTFVCTLWVVQVLGILKEDQDA